jgi:hypothetical protein
MKVVALPVPSELAGRHVSGKIRQAAGRWATGVARAPILRGFSTARVVLGMSIGKSSEWICEQDRRGRLEACTWRERRMGSEGLRGCGWRFWEFPGDESREQRSVALLSLFDGTHWKARICALLVASSALGGCAFLGGVAVGAAGTGAKYEYDKKRELDKLDRSFERGQISKEEYLQRKKEMEKGSIVR